MNNTIFCLPKQGGTIQKAYDRVINQEIGYTKSSNTVRKKYKDKKIIGMSINRTPSLIPKSVLKTVGINTKDKDYDDLYHLFMIITFEDNKQITVEKNEVIKLSPTKSRGSNTETILVNNVPKVTLNELLKNTYTVRPISDTNLTYNIALYIVCYICASPCESIVSYTP